jgi:uncharacterized DUF497 family protein
VLKIVWDEPKRAANVEARGLDMADLEYDFEFFANATIYAGKKGRFVAVGEKGGRIIAVVYQPLGTEAISLVSMRPASRKERRLWEP